MLFPVDECKSNIHFSCVLVPILMKHIWLFSNFVYQVFLMLFGAGQVVYRWIIWFFFIFSFIFFWKQLPAASGHDTNKSSESGPKHEFVGYSAEN